MFDNLRKVVLKLRVLNKPAISLIHEPKTKLVPFFFGPVAEDVHDADKRLED